MCLVYPSGHIRVYCNVMCLVGPPSLVRPMSFVYYPGYVCYVINVDNIFRCRIEHEFTCLNTYIFGRGTTSPATT